MNWILKTTQIPVCLKRWFFARNQGPTFSSSFWLGNTTGKKCFQHWLFSRALMTRLNSSFDSHQKCPLRLLKRPKSIYLDFFCKCYVILSTVKTCLSLSTMAPVTKATTNKTKHPKENPSKVQQHPTLSGSGEMVPRKASTTLGH